MIALTSRSQIAVAFLALFALGILVGLTTKSKVTLAGNESSRLAVVQSVVDNGTFAIDHSIFQTVDKIKIGDHFYSDKPVFLLYWLSFIYWLLHLLFGLEFETANNLTIYLVTLIGIGVFTLLLSLLFFCRLRVAGFPFGLQLLGATTIISTTWIFSYGGTVNNHTPAACVVFALVWILEDSAGVMSWQKALGAGLLAGLLLNLEIPIGCFFFLGGIVTLALRRNSRNQALMSYVTGFTLLVLLMLIMNYVAYGNVLPPGLIRGGKQFAGNIHSLDVGGNRRPLDLPSYLFDITFGDRGLFSYMPALFFAILALANSTTRKKTTIVWLSTVGAVFVFFGCYAGDYGGWAFGFRYLIPVIPILYWYALLWIREQRTVFIPGMFYLTLLVGLITSSVGAYNPWPACFEGPSTQQNAVERNVRNTFTANLLCWSFERDPNSRLTQFLAGQVFEPNVSRAYLPLAYYNMNRPELVRRAMEQTK